MSFVAVAIVGAAGVSAAASAYSSSKASAASKAGAKNAADAQLQGTEMEVGELRRQFDYSMELLRPMVEQQYAAGDAFSNSLGLNVQHDAGRKAEMSKIQEQIDAYARRNAGKNRTPEGIEATDHKIRELEDQMARMRAETPDYPSGDGGGGPGGGGPGIGADGYFVDPNLDQTRLQDTQNLPGQIQNTLLAGTSADDDPYRNYIGDNQIAAATSAEDAGVMRADQVRNAGTSLGDDVYRQDVAGRQLADGAAGTGVYGENFEESVGYGFQVEEMNRAQERKNSAGGNYGGRAMMEATRRAAGVANQEYYNWAGGRERDLGRLGTAEAQDAGRMDRTAENYLARRGTDIGRGDLALNQYENQRIMDQGRGDDAYQNYLSRQAGDASRMDSAVAENDRLQGVDLGRSDAAYNNWLANVRAAAGVGGGVTQSVGVSQNTGAAVGNAYGNQGSNLASIYAREGDNQASIEYAKGAQINNSLQQGASNWMTYKG
jgi:hypothetical protein